MQKKEIIILAEKNQITYQEVLTQLKKDLTISGIDTDFFKETQTFPQLIDDLIFFIEELLAHHPESFSNLIYRIDIPESKIQKIENENIQIAFAELIIKRLIQKIYFRKKYS